MVVTLLIVSVYSLAVWLVFFRFKLLKFNVTWAVISGWVGLHLLIVILIGVRFVAPYSHDVKVVQHTIQLVPRLPEPTLVTEVYVKPNVPVKKGQPLFQFDRRPYEYKVDALKARLAEAKQHVRELKAKVDAAAGVVAQAKAKREMLKDAWAASKSTVAKTKAKRDLAVTNLKILADTRRADAGAVSRLKYDQAKDEVAEAKAEVEVAQADERKARVAYEKEAAAAIQSAVAEQTLARLKYESKIDGTNTQVADIEAKLAEAQYYLDNTTMVAPEDGYLTNLQVRPGMVAGMFRIGAIASFIVDADRYVLATFLQEHLKYVKKGQPVEMAINLYPGRIIKGKVDAIWWGSGRGQYLPSGKLPRFNPVPLDVQGRFAVKIVIDEKDQSKFPIGAEGTVAIYTSETSGFSALRRIEIRGRTWGNWVYPLPF